MQQWVSLYLILSLVCMSAIINSLLDAYLRQTTQSLTSSSQEETVTGKSNLRMFIAVHLPHAL